YQAAIAVVLGGMTLVVLDAGMVTVALPTMARSLHVTSAESVWIVIAYQIAVVMALLPAAVLGDSLGHRRVFTAGVAMFTVAARLCAVAPSLPFLVATRFLQGLGGGAVLALSVALLRGVVRPERFGAAIARNALVVALATAAGPALGSVLLSSGSWPWLFTASIPLGVLVLLGSRTLPARPGTASLPSLASIALHAASVAAVVVGADQMSTRPVLGASLLAAAVLGWAALVRRERPVAAPLVPFDLLRLRPFRSSLMASVWCFAGQTAAMVALPFHLQHGLGQNTLVTGLIMASWPLTVALMAPVTGGLAERVPPPRLGAIGGACLAAGLAGLSLLPLRCGLLPLIPCTILCGVGFSLFNVSNNHTLFLSAPRERTGAAGGVQGTARLAGQTAGTLVMTLVFAQVPMVVAPRVGLAVGAMLAVLAGAVSASAMARTRKTPATKGFIQGGEALPQASIIATRAAASLSSR
ncbi:MAG: MFS transporter, partial [Kiritimatiellia bacterium]